ncbi:MAG: ABC transporter permease [Chloroflexia bacterium]
MPVLWNKAWRDLRVRPARSLLTLVGILIGVAGVVAVVMAGRTLAWAQRQAYQHHSQADITVWVWNANESDVRALEALPGVAAAERRAVAYTQWRAGDRWLDIQLEGLERFEDVRVNQMTLLEGRFPGRGEIALEGSARDLAPLRLGQPIEVRGPAGEIVRLTISGFTRTPYYPAARILRLTVGYVPAATVRPFLGTRGDNRLLIRLENAGQRDEMRAQIENLLDRRRLPRGTLEVRDPEAYTGHRELQTLLRLMTALSILGVVISAFLVTNTLAAVVAEEVREIGILRALGATRWQVLRVYFRTGLAYALTGTPLGLLAGHLGGRWLISYLGYLLNVDVGPFALDPVAGGLGVLVGLGVTVPAALFPAWRGSRITVRQATTGYGIRAESPRFLSRRFLPPLWALPLRNLARRPGRSLTTLLVVAVAVAAFLSARITLASLEHSIVALFGVYAADAWVWFEAPVGAGFAAQLHTVPGVEAAEGWDISYCILGGERVRLWGLPARTALYRYDLVAGRWYLPDEAQAAVLSLDLAQRQGYKVGDGVNLEIAGEEFRFGVVGIVRDEAIFGLGDAPLGKVFLPLEVVQRIYGQWWGVSFFALEVEHNDREDLNAVLAEIERKFRTLHPTTEAMYVGYDQAREGTRIVGGLLNAMVAIVSGVGVVGILNTQTLNVLERRREIGVLRALGARWTHLWRFFLLEGAVLGMLGLALGVPAGWALAQGLVSIISAALITLRFTFLPVDVIWSLFFALLLSSLGGLLPALAAAQLRPVEVLRYE